MKQLSQTIKLTRAVPSLGMAFAIVAFGAPSVLAGDHVHHCRSADGLYSMNDDVLQLFDLDKGRETGPEIQYKVLKKVELRKTKGYCVARKAPRGQRRYDFEGTTYAMQVSFRQNSERVKVFMLCEQASSGLPAAYSCDREVTTKDWVIGKQNTSASNHRNERDSPKPRVTWKLGGSEVSIEADGNRRRVVYVAPMQKLLDRGIKAGDVIFDGVRKGDTYVGTAYINHRRCGKIPYEVKGRVLKGESRVVMKGRRPRLAKGCRTKDWVDARIVLKRQ